MKYRLLIGWLLQVNLDCGANLRETHVFGLPKRVWINVCPSLQIET